MFQPGVVFGFERRRCIGKQVSWVWAPDPWSTRPLSTTPTSNWPTPVVRQLWGLCSEDLLLLSSPWEFLPLQAPWVP